MYNYIFFLLSLLTVLSFGFIAGSTYQYAFADVSPPMLSIHSPTILPRITLQQLTPEYVEFETSDTELRFFTDAGVIVPDDMHRVRIPLPPQEFCSHSQEVSSQTCTFVARKNGRVYYRAESATGKKIPEDERQCFGTQTAAEQAGFKPSTTL